MCAQRGAQHAPSPKNRADLSESRTMATTPGSGSPHPWDPPLGGVLAGVSSGGVNLGVSVVALVEVARWQGKVGKAKVEAKLKAKLASDRVIVRLFVR
jgi:hypothetical protein